MTADQLKIGDTFRHAIPGSRWMTIRGFRAYRNSAHPKLEYCGLTKVADVTDEGGRMFGVTVFPDQVVVRREDVES